VVLADPSGGWTLVSYDPSYWSAPPTLPPPDAEVSQDKDWCFVLDKDTGRAVAHWNRLLPHDTTDDAISLVTDLLKTVDRDALIELAEALRKAAA